MKFSKTLIFCSIVFCSASLFAAEFPFHAVPYYPAFHATLAIANDFNQDGTPDLVMIDSSGKRLGVMNGDGKGGLTAPKFVDSRIRLGAVATGRLNSDPYPDLAAIGVQDASLVIFLNRGDGTFGPPVEYKLRNLPLGISTGDLNGDLQDDIAIAIQGEPTGFVQVLLGSPTGALQPLKAFPMPSPTSVAIGHFGWRSAARYCGYQLSRKFCRHTARKWKRRVYQSLQSPFHHRCAANSCRRSGSGRTR